MLKSYKKAQLKINLSEKARAAYLATDPADIIAEIKNGEIVRIRFCGESWRDYECEFITVEELNDYLERLVD